MHKPTETMPEITDGEAQDLMFSQFREQTNQTVKDFEKIGFWNMECVRISERKQLDDLTYAQKKRDEERDIMKELGMEWRGD